MGKLIGVPKLALRGADKAEAVEKLLSDPKYVPRSRGVERSQYTFLRSLGDPAQLLWVVTFDTFGADHTVPTAVAELLDDVYARAREELDPLCYRISFESYTAAETP